MHFCESLKLSLPYVNMPVIDERQTPRVNVGLRHPVFLLITTIFKRKYKFLLIIIKPIFYFQYTESCTCNKIAIERLEWADYSMGAYKHDRTKTMGVKGHTYNPLTDCWCRNEWTFVDLLFLTWTTPEKDTFPRV